MKTKERLYGAAILAMFQAIVCFLWGDSDYWESLECSYNQPIHYRWWFFAVLSAVLFVAADRRKPTDNFDA